MKIVTFFYLTVWDPSILIRFGEGFEVMKIVTFIIWLFKIPPFWSDLGGRVKWWIRELFFIGLFEIPPFWSDLGRSLRWWKSWPFLSDSLRFLHSDQIWEEGSGDENRDLLFYLTVWDPSILIRFKRNGDVMKIMTFYFIWLFEIPPFWSDMGGRVMWWKSWPFIGWSSIYYRRKWEMGNLHFWKLLPV